MSGQGTLDAPLGVLHATVGTTPKRFSRLRARVARHPARSSGAEEPLFFRSAVAADWLLNHEVHEIDMRGDQVQITRGAGFVAIDKAVKHMPHLGQQGIAEG